MTAPADLRVTKLERAPEGYLRARVSANGRTVDVDRRWGSWQAVERVAPGARTWRRREVLPGIARELQARANRLERAEGRHVPQRQAKGATA